MPGLVFDDERWAYADEWPLYRDETATDLRNLIKTFPLVRHPFADDREDWVELYSDEITSFVEGAVPSAM
jgi:hypothetical protein